MTKSHDRASRIFPTGYWHEFKHIFHLAWPVILTEILQFLMQPLAVVFCGHLGKEELDAVALANSLINVTGVSVINGMCTACDTLFSQVKLGFLPHLSSQIETYGSKRCRHKLGIVLQRAIMIVVLAVIPCWTIHMNTESLLLVLGQDPAVSKLTGEYMFIFMPGLLAYSMYYPLVKYLQNQNIVLPNVALPILPNVVSALLHYLLVSVYQLGTKGSAIAQACGYSTFLPVILAYIYFSKVYKGTWFGWSWECLLNWGQFFRLAVAGLFMVCIEWWSFEIGSFLAGVLGTTELGAQSILLQSDVICYRFGLGVGIASNIRVGQYLGGNNPLGAKTVYRTAVTMITMLNLVVGILLATLSREIAMIFTNVQEVVDLTVTLLPIVGAYLVWEGLTAVSTGVLRGCGRQHIAASVVCITYIFIALPVGICLMFLTPMRTSGLWWTLCAALFCDVVVYQIVLYKTDWDDQAAAAYKRIGARISESYNHNQADEKTALCFKEELSNGKLETSKRQRTSVHVPPRKTSFFFPDPDIEFEKSMQADLSSEPLHRLIVRRLLVLVPFILLLTTGILCRVFVPIPDYTHNTELIHNLTTVSRTTVEGLTTSTNTLFPVPSV